MRVVTMKVTFDGLYFWGSGWKDGSVYKKWYDFWTSKSGDGIFWTHFLKDDGINKTQYLVTTGGSSYLHPMGFEVLYRLIGGCYKTNEKGEKVDVLNEIEELKGICEKCADICGGAVKFTIPKICEFNC